MYWYIVLTTGDSLPHKVFRSPDHWSYNSDFADQTTVVFSLPSAGVYCRVVARYCKYIVTFQYRDRESESIETELQALWEDIDAHVGESLGR